MVPLNCNIAIATAHETNPTLPLSPPEPPALVRSTSHPIVAQSTSEDASSSQNTPNEPGTNVTNEQITFPVQSSRISNEPSAPDSLLNAPPSYSFVMRQVASRQRPRYMGTFVPSPSFVQHAPPPTYATNYDLYVDPQVAPVTPAPPSSYGFHPILLVCPECGNLVLTALRSELAFCTHVCAGLLCLCFCWICVPIPYLLRSCKNVYHHCPICRSLLGMYSPTNNA